MTEHLTGTDLTAKYSADITGNISKLTTLKTSSPDISEIIDKFIEMFKKATEHIAYLTSLIGPFGVGGTQYKYEDSKLQEIEFLINDTRVLTADNKDRFQKIKPEDITALTISLEKLTEIYTSIKESDKINYLITELTKDGGYVEDINGTSNDFKYIFKNFVVMKTNISAATATAAASTPAASTHAAPTLAASTATAASTTPGAVAFTIQGEINIESKQISKITSIKINDCAEITDIKTDSGKIKEDKDLTDKITKCITGPESTPTTKGGRKHRTTVKKQSKKRPRRKSYRRFQSRRRA
jgi:hypothetical protein